MIYTEIIIRSRKKLRNGLTIEVNHTVSYDSLHYIKIDNFIEYLVKNNEKDLKRKEAENEK